MKASMLLAEDGVPHYGRFLVCGSHMWMHGHGVE